MLSLYSFGFHLHCTICGGRIAPAKSRTSETMKWQEEVVLLSDPDCEFERCPEYYQAVGKRDTPQLSPHETQNIRKTNARSIGGKHLQIITTNDDGEATHGQEVYIHYPRISQDEDGQSASTVYYVATHKACLDIAETVMCLSPTRIVVRDLRTLWRVLRARLEAAYDSEMVTGNDQERVKMPHSYYMQFQPCPQSLPANSMTERWDAADPLDVPNMTSEVLENLRSLPPATPTVPKNAAFQKRFLSLPPELRDHICSFLASRNGMPSLCNGLLPQWTWREVLLRGKCLPFLRDLDGAVIEEFSTRWGKEHRDQEPNWELLARKLSQEAWCIWDAESSLLKIPSGLRNRRRIWMLVEEMYIGDVDPR